MSAKKKKDSVSVNACLGPDLFRMLEILCEETGQSKTVAVEWAIRAYCRGHKPAADVDDNGGGA